LHDDDAHHQQHQTAGQSPTDLSHLRPDRLRLGSVGVFAGDWAWTGDPPRIPVGFVGTLIDRWNGWAVFTCTREVAEAIVADQDRMRGLERARLVRAGVTGEQRRRQLDEAVSPMWFDGDVLVCDDTVAYDDPSAVDRQSPGADGRYCVQGFHWCWIAVDPADCDRIAGVLPAPGQAQEFVYAVHEPLRMPHDRLTVASIDYLAATPNGVVFRAVLHLDGQPVGTIDNPGNGAATTFHPATAAFGRRQIDAFVAGCRWRGQPVDEAQVLESLITEYETNGQIAVCDAEGLTPIVLRDGDGRIVAAEYGLDKTQIRRLGQRGLADLARQLTASEASKYPLLSQFVWEIWTGRQWRLMDIVDLPRDLAGGR
jgi:hypothetical protein